MNTFFSKLAANFGRIYSGKATPHAQQRNKKSLGVFIRAKATPHAQQRNKKELSVFIRAKPTSHAPSATQFRNQNYNSTTFSIWQEFLN